MNKISRHIVTIGNCEICGREDESIMHALLWCNHAVSLREAMRQYWELPDEEQYISMAPSSLLHILDSLETDMAARVLLLLSRTWQVRNDITHEKGKFSIEGSVSFMRRYWVKLCNARQEDGHGDLHGKSPVLDSLVAGKQRRSAKVKEHWTVPQEGWVKINVDGAFEASSGEGSIVVVIRNHKGEVQLSAWRFLQAVSDAGKQKP
jgi:hypothetical protein